MFSSLKFKVILFGFIFTFFSSFGQSYFLGLFNSSIREALSITHGQFGSIYASATLCSSLLLIWVGKKIDDVNIFKFAFFSLPTTLQKRHIEILDQTHQKQLICTNLDDGSKVLRHRPRQTKPAWGSLFDLPFLSANQGRLGLYVLTDPFLIRLFSVADHFWRQSAVSKNINLAR